MTDRDCRRCGLKLTLENARTFDGRWTGACRDCEKLIGRERQGDRHAHPVTVLRLPRELRNSLADAANARLVSMNWLATELLREGVANLLPANELRLTREAK